MHPLFRSCAKTFPLWIAGQLVAGFLLSCGDDEPPPETPGQDAAVDPAGEDADENDATIDPTVDAIDITEEEVGEVLASIGQPCDEDEDCDTGLCIQIELREERGLCSRQCETDEDCPEEDMTCREDPLPGPRDRSYCLGLLCIDGDEDGYGIGRECEEDCDDDNPDVNPGAEERCDGLDTDCSCDEGLLGDCSEHIDNITPYDLESELGDEVYSGTTAHWGDSFVADPRCEGEGEGADDRAFMWTAPEAGDYNFKVVNAEFEPVLYARHNACPSDPDHEELACLVHSGWMTVEDLEDGETIILIVDGTGPTERGEFDLSISFDRDLLDSEVGLCADEFDNDGDGWTDCADEDCVDEHNCIPEVCSGGADDDNDTFIDCADDECSASHHCIAEICDNHADDDGDGAVGCEDTECSTHPNCIEVCDNDTDDDDDGRVDCADEECSSNPICPPAETVCDDDSDNDSDGFTDCADSDCIGNSVCERIPHDPIGTMPDLPETTIPRFEDLIDGLISGDHPIQFEVEEDAVEERRVAVLRGTVFDVDMAPLPGVRISVLGHPELGHTFSRSDGMFDLVVNGGWQVTVEYEKGGYISSQRQTHTPWHDFVWLPDVVMVQHQPATLVQGGETVDAIDLVALAAEEGTFAVVEAVEVTDDAGTRSPRILIPAGISAQMTFPEEGPEDLTELSFSVTEMTVGDTGPAAMVADLPPTTGYTYLVDVSVAEAVDEGATSVELSENVVVYVENFLNFPNGTPVPVGYYDSQRGAWVAAPNGHVIEVTSIDETLGAGLDIDEIEGEDSREQAISELGMTPEELIQLGELHGVGTSLWRFELSHFSPWDCNWPYGPPGGAGAPPNSGNGSGDGSASEGDSGSSGQEENTPATQNDCTQGGSIIHCLSQVLGEIVPISGTPFNLFYQSDRVPGRVSAYTLEIPLTGDSVPADVKRIEVLVSVAGQQTVQSYNCQTGAPQCDVNQTYTYVWDGRDGYGRTVMGTRVATVTTGYVYDAVYYEPGDFEESFGQLGGAPIAADEARAEVTIFSDTRRVLLGTWDARAVGLGGWTIDVHHTYDGESGQLYLGDGARRSLLTDPAVDTVAGSGDQCYVAPCGDGGAAVDAGMGQVYGLAVGADGTLYVAADSAVRAVDPITGLISTVAGTQRSSCADRSGLCGDGPDATAAQFMGTDVAVTPDGILYVADLDRVRMVDVDGSISTVAGGPGAATPLEYAYSLALNPRDGSLLIGDRTRNQVLRLGTNGDVTVFAGTGASVYSGDGGQAINAGFRKLNDIAVTNDGVTYVLDRYCVRRIDTAGNIDRYAGDCEASGAVDEDGVPALSAHFYVPTAIDVDSVGNLVISDFGNYRTRVIDGYGIIRTISGSGSACTSDPTTCGEDVYSTQADLGSSFSLALGPNNEVYFADGNRARIIHPAVPGMLGGVTIPSADGTEIYAFDLQGRHLQTVDSFTGDVIYEFFYQPGTGYLESIADAFGETTTIERTSTGIPSAIEAPFEQRTTLLLDSFGYLESLANPVPESHTFTYYAGGLMETMTDPLSDVSSFEYDSYGRLTRDDMAGPGDLVLERTDHDNGYQVATTTAEGRTTIYLVESLPDGGMRWETTLPGNVVVESRQQADFTTTITYPDGTVETRQDGTDPRFQTVSPMVVANSVETPAGLRLSSEVTREVTLYDPADYLSFTAWAETVDVNNGRVYSRSYDVGRTWTITGDGMPDIELGLESHGLIDSVQIAEFAPLETEYNAHGQAVMLAQRGDDDTTDRAVTNGYDSQGNEQYRIVASDYSVGYTHNLAGRPEQVTVFTPVCATGDITYPNRCAAECGGFDTYTQGACVASSECPNTWLPVCTPGGLTYPNACEAERAGLTESEYSPCYQTCDCYDTYTPYPDTDRTVQVSLDANGNLTSVTTAEGYLHLMEYSERDDLETYQPPDVGGGADRMVLALNADRQLDLFTQPTGATADIVYESGSDRVDYITTDLGQIDWVYDIGTGQLSSITTEAGAVLAFTYDGFLPTHWEWSGPVVGTVSYAYNHDFAIYEQTVGGETVAFGYEDGAVLMNAGDLVITRYPASGLIHTTALGDVTTEQTYDIHGDLASFDAKSDGSVIYSYEILRRDALARVVEIDETVQGVTTSYRYGYEQERLSEVYVGDVLTYSYDYDLNGNRTGHVNEVTAESLSCTYDERDRLDGCTGHLTVDYDWDTDGNAEQITVVDGAETTVLVLDYDVFGNLRGVDRNVNGTDLNVDYILDGLGRRIGRDESGVTGWLYQDQLNPIAELNSANEVVSRFVFGTRSNVPDYMTKDGRTVRFITDFRGSPRLLVDVDTGEVLQRLDYDPWGLVLDDTEPGYQPFGFSGGHYDPDTGLVRFGARDYHATTGRWTSRDPVLFGGLDSNLYTYAFNDPVNIIDSDGMFGLTVLIVGGLVTLFTVNYALNVVMAKKLNILKEQWESSPRSTINDLILDIPSNHDAAITCQRLLDDAREATGPLVRHTQQVITEGMETAVLADFPPGNPVETALSVINGEVYNAMNE